MDELERQIKEARAALDTSECFDEDGIWLATTERLAGRNVRKRRIKWRIWTATAAAILLLLSLTWHLRPRPNEAPALQLADLSPELAAEENELRKAIREKEAALHLDRLDPARYGPYFEEISTLDSLRTEYLADLPAYGRNERLVTTLLRLYELKIQLLLQLENELLKQENYDPPQEI
ncbi:MAG: hypothetical protein AAFN92_06160 [Bacteroidota bacterium]